MNKLSTNTNPDLVPPPLFQTNDLLGRFVLGNCISKGPLFHIYHAHDPLRHIDIRIILANAGSQIAKILLEDSFRIATMFSACENIINVYEIHQFEYGPAQVMALSTEYASEGTLDDWVKNNRSNVELRRQEGGRIITELVNILDLIENQGLFLLDFNPAHFLLVNGHLKVASLMSPTGFSALCSQQVDLNFMDPRYKAPEWFVATKSSELSMASNIYSFGILAYEILSENAHPPFEGSYEQVVEKHRFLEPSFAGIEPVFEPVLRCCLAKSAAKRPQNTDGIKMLLVNSPNTMLNENANELRVLLSRLGDAMTHGDVCQASALCREALELDPDLRDVLEVKEQLAPVVKQIHRCLEELRINIYRWDINYSLEMLNRAVQLNGYPTEEMYDYLDILEHRYAECRRFAQYGKSAAAQQNWPLALDYIERAWKMNCCDAELTSWQTALTDIIEAKRGMEAATQNENWPVALYHAEKLESLVGQISGDESE